MVTPSLPGPPNLEHLRELTDQKAAAPPHLSISSICGRKELLRSKRLNKNVKPHRTWEIERQWWLIQPTTHMDNYLITIRKRRRPSAALLSARQYMGWAFATSPPLNKGIFFFSSVYHLGGKVMAKMTTLGHRRQNGRGRAAWQEQNNSGEWQRDKNGTLETSAHEIK